MEEDKQCNDQKEKNINKTYNNPQTTTLKIKIELQESHYSRGEPMYHGRVNSTYPTRPIRHDICIAYSVFS